MIINNTSKISKREFELIKLFLKEYINNSLVADSCIKDMETLYIEDSNISIPNAISMSDILFQRYVNYSDKDYIINLLFEQFNYENEDLVAKELSIVSDNEIHRIDLRNNDDNNELLFDIANVFNKYKKDRIITPYELYRDNINISSTLWELINNNCFKEIENDLDNNNSLVNNVFLFLSNSNDNRYSISFATVLYLLLNYRINNSDKLGIRKQKALDNLIVKYSDNSLLRLDLEEKRDCYYRPSDSILLKKYNGNPLTYQNLTRSSKRYTIENGELAKEVKVLRKVLSNRKN